MLKRLVWAATDRELYDVAHLFVILFINNNKQIDVFKSTGVFSTSFSASTTSKSGENLA